MSENLTKTLTSRLKFPILFLILIWAIHLFQFITGISLLGYGIMPRHTEGLDGILFSPLLHSRGFGHIVSNSAPLIAGMSMIWLFYKKVAIKSFTFIYLLTGLAVWAFAMNSNSIHIGASGVVYGLISFLFWNGVFRRNVKSIVLSLIIIFMYSGMLYGVLPTQSGVSWESHLFGAIVGMIASYLFKNQIEKDEIQHPPSWEVEPETKKRFLDQDTFKRPEEILREDDNFWKSDTTEY